jgi:hypothetical protein
MDRLGRNIGSKSVGGRDDQTLAGRVHASVISAGVLQLLGLHVQKGRDCWTWLKLGHGLQQLLLMAGCSSC